MGRSLTLIPFKHCWIYEDCLKDGILAGFTRPHIQNIQQISLVLDELKVKAEISYLHQIHSEIIHSTDRPGCLCGDGLLTSSEHLILIVKTADCMPLLLYEQEGKNIGAVHMGWKSAVNGILSNLPSNLLNYRLVAGPALRPCCYEVGKEFLHYALPETCLTPREKKEGGDGKLTFDPVAFTRQILFSRGLKDENVTDAGICTFCHPLSLPSYRRTKNRDRIFNFIMKDQRKRE